MTNTAILTETGATIMAEETSRFRWGIAIAGAIAATATSFFLLTLGSGVGLALASPAHAKSAGTFLTLGAIYFLAAQAFGFAVGGYLVGRLIGPEVENTAEEEFRAAAHGFVMWALAVVAGLLLLGFASTMTGSAVAGAKAMPGAADNSSNYWVDTMFRPAPNTAQVEADKAEAGRILAINGPATNDADTTRLARLVSENAGISMSAAMLRVADSEAQMKKAADDARKAASMVALWTALALLFGGIVAVASAISARWMDDRITFGLAPRR
ncbi:MAG: hypothetical protein ABI963_09915 [Rhizomicrobium sp.]